MIPSDEATAVFITSTLRSWALDSRIGTASIRARVRVNLALKRSGGTVGGAVRAG